MKPVNNKINVYETRKKEKIRVVSWFEFKSPSIWISVIDRRKTKQKNVTVLYWCMVYSISVLEIKELILFIALTTWVFFSLTSIRLEFMRCGWRGSINSSVFFSEMHYTELSFQCFYTDMYSHKKRRTWIYLTIWLIEINCA